MRTDTRSTCATPGSIGCLLDLAIRGKVYNVSRVALKAVLATTLSVAGHSVHSQTVNICGSLHDPTHYGPFDYRTSKARLPIVENSHFTPNIEAGAGSVEYNIGPNLNYTLKSFPNHPRALVTLVRTAERLKLTKLPNMTWDVECYFERGIRFAPDDTVVRGLYAQYLIKAGKKDQARRQLEDAEYYAKDNGVTHYNIGLLYLELGDYDKAQLKAHRAKELDFERNEIEIALKKAGKWQQPLPASSSASSAETKP
jgi:hypothetical protein